MTKSDQMNYREVYNLIDTKVSRVEEKVDTLTSKVATIEGRLLMLPILVSTGISAFFLIVNLVMK